MKINTSKIALNSILFIFNVFLIFIAVWFILDRTWLAYFAFVSIPIISIEIYFCCADIFVTQIEKWKIYKIIPILKTFYSVLIIIIIITASIGLRYPYIERIFTDWLAVVSMISLIILIATIFCDYILFHNKKYE